MANEKTPITNPPILVPVENYEKLKQLYRQVKEIAEGKHINVILPRSKD